MQIWLLLSVLRWLGYSELETVKMISTSRKINAIFLNIKINRPKFVSMYRYKLATNWQNFTGMYLA